MSPYEFLFHYYGDMLHTTQYTPQTNIDTRQISPYEFLFHYYGDMLHGTYCKRITDTYHPMRFYSSTMVKCYKIHTTNELQTHVTLWVCQNLIQHTLIIYVKYCNVCSNNDWKNAWDRNQYQTYIYYKHHPGPGAIPKSKTGYSCVL